MNRRELLLAAAAATCAPGRAFAQPASRKFRVLALHSAPIRSGPYHGALKERLAKHGFIEGKNLLDDTQYKHTPHEYREIAPETTYRWDNTYVGRRYYVGMTYTF